MWEYETAASNTYKHIHIYIHTHIHAYIHSHVHTYTNTYIHTHTHTHTHTCTRRSSSPIVASLSVLDMPTATTNARPASPSISTTPKSSQANAHINKQIDRRKSSSFEGLASLRTASSSSQPSTPKSGQVSPALHNLKRMGSTRHAGSFELDSPHDSGSRTGSPALMFRCSG